MSRGSVSTGVPAQRTSIPVVWPLQRGVSRHRSASLPRLTCSSLGATGEKMILPCGSPSLEAIAATFGSPAAGNFSNQRTLFGTRLRMFIHISRVDGSILYSWLKLQNMTAFSGSWYWALVVNGRSVGRLRGKSSVTSGWGGTAPCWFDGCCCWETS